MNDSVQTNAGRLERVLNDWAKEFLSKCDLMGPQGRVQKYDRSSAEASQSPWDDVCDLLLLGVATKLVLNAADPRDGDYKMALHRLLKAESHIDHGARSEELYRVTWALGRELLKSKEYAAIELKNAHPYFEKNVTTLIPGAVIVKEKKLRGGSCDFVVEVDGERRPVEIKREKFGYPAKRQLRSYMEVYGAGLGYACAPKLACDLDPDMSFVELDFVLPHGKPDAPPL